MGVVAACGSDTSAPVEPAAPLPEAGACPTDGACGVEVDCRCPQCFEGAPACTEIQACTTLATCTTAVCQDDPACEYPGGLWDPCLGSHPLFCQDDTWGPGQCGQFAGDDEDQECSYRCFESSGSAEACTAAGGHCAPWVGHDNNWMCYPGADPGPPYQAFNGIHVLTECRTDVQASCDTICQESELFCHGVHAGADCFSMPQINGLGSSAFEYCPFPVSDLVEGVGVRFRCLCGAEPPPF